MYHPRDQCDVHSQCHRVNLALWYISRLYPGDLSIIVGASLSEPQGVMTSTSTSLAYACVRVHAYIVHAYACIPSTYLRACVL